MKRLSLVLALFSLGIALPRATPQNPPPAAQTPAFRAAVDLVRIDVSVYDRNRKPVRGLTAADFTVLENGRPRPVDTFSAIDLPEPVAPPTAWIRDVAPDIRDNTLNDSRLFVLLLDDALIPMDPAFTKSAKEIAKKFIDQLGPADLAAVVLTADNRGAQNFTSDHGRLLATLDKFSPGMATYTFSPQEPDAYFMESAIGALRNVTDYLTAVPNRRKTLVWISPGVAVDPEAMAPQLASREASMAEREAQLGMIADTQELFREAQRANVTVHVIDPTGPGGMERFIVGKQLAQKGSDRSLPAKMELASKKATATQDFARAMATNTGGRATNNTTDFDTAITQIFQDSSSYYLIGFKPGTTKTDGSLQRLEVKVNRPDVEVRTRTGYYAPDATRAAELAAAEAASPLTMAMSGLLPIPDMPMQVMAAPFAIPKIKGSTATAGVAIVLAVRQLAPEDAAKIKVTETVSLQTGAFTPEGTSRGMSRQDANIVLREGVTGQFAYEVITRIDLAPGRYELRLALHSNSLGKSGSVFTDVDVPDFFGAPLSMSGVLVNAAPVVAYGPKEALGAFVPIVPTTVRDFTAADKVNVFMRVYQGGNKALQPVAITARIVDEKNATVFTNDTSVTADKFAADTRGADYRLDLPTLAGKGRYLLTLKATMGARTSSRDLRFRIR